MALLTRLNCKDNGLEGMKENLQREFPTKGSRHNKIRNWGYKYPEGNTIEVIKDLGLEEHYKHMS